MRRTSLFRLALGAVAALAVSACGGSSSGGQGRINVRLVDGPAVEFKHIVLNIQRVEIAGPDGWQTIGPTDPEKTQAVDLLSLVNGVSADLVADRGIPAGHYTQLRLVLGDGNQIQLANGDIEPLTVPSGMQSGIKVNVEFDVADGATADVYLDLDAKQSIFVHTTGNSGKYMLRPRINAVADEVGAVTGTFVTPVDATTTKPLAGVAVLAEKFVDGKPVIVRSTVTDADGRYTLDLLRMDGTQYYVVAQPVVPAAVVTDPPVVYGAAASGPIVPTTAAPVQTYNRAFTSTDQVGSMSGTIAPPPSEDQGDWLSIAQVLAVGTTTDVRSFIVREQPVHVIDGAGNYAVDDLPAGAGYSAWITRSQTDGFGDVTTIPGAPATFDVTAGADVTVTFP